VNVFSAFTFGSLIKTFLPGLVWLIAIVLIVTDIEQLVGAPRVIWDAVQGHDQAALVLSFPASILLGLLSNILVFMGVNDRLVRNRARRVDPDLFRLHDQLKARILDRYWKLLGHSDDRFRPVFDKHVDVEIIMLDVLGTEKVAYLREQYWYHLEFQINLLMSLILMFFALVLNAFLSFSACGLVWILTLYVIFFVPLCLLLLVAARKNYQRHVAKVASLMAAMLDTDARQNNQGSPALS